MSVLSCAPALVKAEICDIREIPSDLYELIQEKQYDNALDIALSKYEDNTDDKEANVELTKVYLNSTLVPAVNFDLKALGFGQGETGSKKVTEEALKAASSDGFNVNKKYLGDARSFVEKTVNRWPETANLYYCLTKVEFYTRNHKVFLESLKRTVDLMREDKQIVDYMLGYATEYMNNQQFRKAKDTYEVLLSQFPNSVPVLSSLGVSYLKLGHSAKSLSYFEKAHAIDANDAIVISNIAEAAMLLRQNEKAERFLLLKRKKDPNNTSIFFDLAINAYSDKPAASLKWWDKYFEANKTSPDAEAWVRNAKMLKKAAVDETNNLDAWYGLGGEMIRAGIPKYAISFFSYVAKMKPFDAGATYSMAHAYDIGRHYDLQEKVLLETLDRLKSPENMVQLDSNEIYYNLSRSAYSIDDFNKVIGYLDKMKETDESPRVAYMYGLTFRALRDKEKAKMYFNKCIESDSGAPVIQNCRKYLQN